MDAAKGRVTKVFVLEDDHDAREMIADVLHETLSVDAITAGSVDEMTAADGVMSCSLAILDVNLGSGRRSGLDAYQWLRAHGFRGEIVFLTGHASHHPLVSQARSLGAAKVIEKPISFDELCGLVHGGRMPGGD
jgi:DNA-binding response OmpR family regulator